MSNKPTRKGGSNQLDDKKNNEAANVTQDPKHPPPEDSDDSDDDDFDPDQQPEPSKQEQDLDDDEPVPDYSDIQALDSLFVKTRRQRYQETNKKDYNGLVHIGTSVDIDAIFAGLNDTNVKQEWLEKASTTETVQATPPPPEPEKELEPQTITIKLTYAFAGKIVTLTKTVDVNSAEAKAYLNSTAKMTSVGEEKKYRLFVPVMRMVPGEDEPRELRIKLKRPSLIDKVVTGSGKKIKLLTLEKSRLDWALFVDERNIQDELKIGNRGGYLEKQDFLGRLEAKRDENYQNAKDEDRRRKFLQQNG